MSLYMVAFLALLGAVAQQWFHYRDLHARLSPESWNSLKVGSRYYIFAAVDVMVFSTIATVYILSKKDLIYSPFEIVVIGAAAPALFKNAVSGLSKRNTIAGDPIIKTASAYFGIE